MRDRIFYAVCFGFLFGILLRSFVAVSLDYVFLFLLISFGVFLFFGFVSENKWGLIFSVFILAFFGGVWRFNSVDVPNPEAFEAKVGQTIYLEGEIIDEPNIKENNQQLLVLAEAEDGPLKILISENLSVEYRYGDKIELEGILKKPENFITETGKEFDYVNYLRKDGILYAVAYPKIEVVARGGGNVIKRALFALKEKFLEKINFSVPEPENLLLGGLILGERSAFSEELRKSFVRTGTIHIVALSGYNVTIVAEWMMRFFSFLPKNLGIGAGIGAILLFILMTGATSTAVRAGIMAVLALFARATGRNYDAGRALVLAGVLMVLFNPFLLAFDVSFQLSFIATVAVIFFSPRLEKYFQWATKRFGLRDVLSVTTAAYLLVFPFILCKMGNLSVLALPANVLIQPLIPFTMLLGFLTGFFGLLWHFLAVPIGFISYLFLRYEIGVIDFLSNLPFASFDFPNFPLSFTLLIYAYFIYKLFGREIKNFFTAPC